jgi:hypothetical protein
MFLTRRLSLWAAAPPVPPPSPEPTPTFSYAAEAEAKLEAAPQDGWLLSEVTPAVPAVSASGPPPGLNLVPPASCQVSVSSSTEELPDFVDDLDFCPSSASTAAPAASTASSSCAPLRKAELEVRARIELYVAGGGSLEGLSVLLQLLKHDLGLSWKRLNAACATMGLCLSDRCLLGSGLRARLKERPLTRMPRALLGPELRLVKRAFMVRLA